MDNKLIGVICNIKNEKMSTINVFDDDGKPSLYLMMTVKPSLKKGKIDAPMSFDLKSMHPDKSSAMTVGNYYRRDHRDQSQPSYNEICR